MNLKSDFALLLRKFQDGTISPEELTLLYELLNSSEKSKERDAAFRQLWENTGNMEKVPSSTNTWNKLEDLIQKSSPKPAKQGKTIHINLKEILKYAAVVLITFSVSWFTFSRLNKSADVQNELTAYSVPLGSKSTLLLPDGTKVWLNSGSKITYNNHFTRNNRTINLEGEAYFDVVPHSKIPFVVKTSDLNIRVYGTKFNVKSFSNERVVETTLVKGSITIERVSRGGRVIQKLKMTPNQMVDYIKPEGKLVLVNNEEETTSPVIVKNKGSEYVNNISPLAIQRVEIATSWKDNRLTFKGENFESLKNKLERWYGVEITIKNNKLEQSKFTGSFDKETIEQALFALQITIPFKYTMDKNKITIY